MDDKNKRICRAKPGRIQKTAHQIKAQSHATSLDHRLHLRFAADYSFRTSIMSPFVSDSAVIQISRKYMITVSSFYPLLNHLQLRRVSPWHRGYTGLYDYNLCCLYLIRIPTAVLLSEIIGVNDIWWGKPMRSAIGLIIL